MKTALRLIVFVVVLLSLVSKGQAQHTFERHFGGARYDAASDVIETPDGGFLVWGTTRSVSNDTTDAYLLKIDATGDSLWSKVYGGPLWDSGVALTAASDTGYVLALASNSFNPGNYDVHLIKIGEDGTPIWRRNYGGPGTDYVHGLRPTADGGYVAIAHTLSYGAGSFDFYLLRLDQHGDTLWTKTYGGAESDWGGFVDQTADGGFVMTGDTYSFGHPDGDIYLIRTDALGDTLWTRTYGGAAYDRAYHVLEVDGGGFLVTGITESFGLAGAHGYLVRTDAAGDTLWTRTVGAPYGGVVFTSQQASDGNFVAVGGKRTSEPGNTELLLVKLDDEGRILWSTTSGGPGYDEGFDVKETADGGFILAGLTTSFGDSQDNDIYVVKTNPLGEQTDVELVVPDRLPARLENYPNPFVSSTTIEFLLPKAGRARLAVFDLLGRQVATLIDSHLLPGRHAVEWRAQSLPAGVYVCRLQWEYGAAAQLLTRAR